MNSSSLIKFIKKNLRYFVSVGLIVLLIINFDYRVVLSIVAKANLWWVLIGVLAVGGNVLSSAWRLSYILRIFKLKKSIWYLTKLYLVGNFYNNFLPTQMGGDVYKAYRLSKDLGKTGEGTFTIFMDRFSGLMVLYVIGLVGIFVKFKLIGLVVAVGLLVFAIVAYYIALKFFSSDDNFLYNFGFIKNTKLNKFVSKFSKFVGKFKKANDVFVDNKIKALNVFFTALFVQFFAMLTTIAAFYAVGAEIPIWAFLMYIPVVTIMGLIPSVNGLGIQDFSYVFFFGQFASPEQAAAASLIVHLTRFSTSLFGGFVTLLPDWHVEKMPNSKNVVNGK